MTSPVTLRLLVFACVATASLALADNAFAKTPALLVSGSNTVAASGTTLLEVKGVKEDAAWARISIYVPIGYVTNLSQPTGTQIGTVVTRAQLLDFSPDAIIDVSGTILVDDRSDAKTQSSATQCTGTPEHTAVWLLHLVVSGQTIDVPVYVDPTAGPEATFSSTKFVLCLPNPYMQALAGTRSPGGTKIIDAKTTLSAGVLTNPPSAGTYLWRTVITEWTANGATPNLPRTSEAQSIVNIPSSLSLKAKVRTIQHKNRRRTTVTNSVLLSGSLLENLKGIAGARVTLFANGKTAGSTLTDATGAFAKVNSLTKKASFKATATVPARETACVSPLPATSAPAGCVAATIAGYKISSNTIIATPRKRP